MINDEVTGSKLSSLGELPESTEGTERWNTASYRSKMMWMDVGPFVPGTTGGEQYSIQYFPLGVCVCVHARVCVCVNETQRERNVGGEMETAEALLWLHLKRILQQGHPPFLVPHPPSRPPPCFFLFLFFFNPGLCIPLWAECINCSPAFFPS